MKQSGFYGETLGMLIQLLPIPEIPELLPIQSDNNYMDKGSMPIKPLKDHWIEFSVFILCPQIKVVHLHRFTYHA